MCARCRERTKAHENPEDPGGRGTDLPLAGGSQGLEDASAAQGAGGPPRSPPSPRPSAACSHCHLPSAPALLLPISPPGRTRPPVTMGGCGLAGPELRIPPLPAHLPTFFSLFSLRSGPGEGRGEVWDPPPTRLPRGLGLYRSAPPRAPFSRLHPAGRGAPPARAPAARPRPLRSAPGGGGAGRVRVTRDTHTPTRTRRAAPQRRAARLCGRAPATKTPSFSPATPRPFPFPSPASSLPVHVPSPPPRRGM